MQTHDRPVLTCTRARQTRTHHNPRPHQNLPDITAGYPDQQLLMSGLRLELVGNLFLSLSKIVTEARTVAEDPAIDGFGHHNPQLGQEDDLFYSALAINQVMEGFFCGRDLSTNETQFFHLIRMGILDGREGYDMPMTASTRVMRHTVAVSSRLWVMYEHERQRVNLQVQGSLCAPY